MKKRSIRHFHSDNMEAPLIRQEKSVCYKKTADCNLLFFKNLSWILLTFSKIWKYLCTKTFFASNGAFNSFMQRKSIDWFLYDRDLRHERVTTLPNIYDETFWENSSTIFITQSTIFMPLTSTKTGVVGSFVKRTSKVKAKKAKPYDLKRCFLPSRHFPAQC